MGHNVHIESATIGNRALISSGSIVLNGATVGEGASSERARWLAEHADPAAVHGAGRARPGA